jgi:hypothetical protein
MDDNTNSTVTPTPDAAPPVVPNAPMSGPDLSALSQPGASRVAGQAAPNYQTAALGSAQQSLEESNVYAKKAADLASAPPVAPPNVPHARLMNLISALSTGLSAAGTAMATGGREGGAEEVVRIQGEQQQQKIQAQNAAIQQRNSAVQTQLTAGETARANAQNYILLATMHDQVDASHFKAQSEQQNLASGSLELQSKAQEMFDTKGQVPAGWTVDANTGQVSQGQSQTPASGAAPSGQSTPAPGAAPTGTVAPVTSIFNTRQNMILDAAGQELKDAKGNDDPLVTAARQILTNPNSTPVQKRQATLAVQNKAGLSADVVKNLTAKADLAAKQNVAENLPKNQQEASIQLAAAQQSGDATRIRLAQANKAAVDATVQDERKFSANLQAQNAAVNKQTQFSNTLAQKGIEDTNKLWTDPQHGFAQTRAQVEATKNVVAQAKNGSELAASLEPAMTVLGVNSFAGVHRISPTEYEAAGPQVGSLYRRLNAMLDKAGKGAVPSATLSEVNGIMDALVRGKYQASLDSTRQIIGNSGIPTNRIFVPDPSNYSALTTLDKIPVTSTGTQTAPTFSGSPASKLHANMSDFKQTTPTKEHGNLYTDDGKTWYTQDGTIYGGKK